ncbi:cobalt transporter [Spirulina subsalsa FACHB-351]|uniref:Cobalt transporter n=1 Tax=Spirulina subsalsa FACHB-351 TaxID=234711 RepID=A0ABT3L3U8_9CYAN|nr:efflux RND transporter periplasmic adaptor subunit [Spirulina subsalsa]MCW6036193.1 cobalt transporter [Spirulina subsalsa FACHB-351]
MNTTSIIGSMFAIGLIFGTPTLTLAHVGHGDEFQAEGGIDRVPVNSETDSLLGIEVAPIAPAFDGSSRVLVPMTALVDADGKQLAFVLYGNFYEPVPVQIGATEGEWVEVTDGLSLGEQLVTQGSLSLYAESRKTQTATTAPSPETATTPTDDVQTQNLPQEDPTEDNLTATSSFPIGKLAAVGGGVLIICGGMFFWTGSRRNKNLFSDK